LSYAQVLPAFRRAIADAAHQHGIVGRLIPSIDREASPRAAQEMVEWVCAHRCDEVPGIGMDYRENDRPPELFQEAYALARKAGLKTTAHAGEFGMPWTNVKTAMEVLKVDRVDHGYTIVDNMALVERAAVRVWCSPWCLRIPITCGHCPRALGAGPPDPKNACAGSEVAPEHR